MPLAKKKTAQRMPRKMTARPRRGLTTKGKGSRVNDVAAVSESYGFVNGIMDTVYWDYSCSLFQHERAREVAQAYQEYKIKLIEYKFKPLSDTYTPGAGVVPYLYYLIDKARSNNGLLTIDGFKQAGCKPIRLDDRTVTIKYKPAVLVDSYDSATAGGLPVRKLVSPWLSTNDYNVQNPSSGSFSPSQVDHNGIRWLVDGTSSEYQYSIERIVHIEFRKPLWTEASGEQLPGVDISTTMTIPTFVPPHVKPPPVTTE